MENLEQYIKNNLEEFDSGDLPAGSRERFMTKLEDSRKRAKSRRRYLFIGPAAGIAACVLLAIFIGHGRDEVNGHSEHYMAILTTLNREIISLAMECDEMTADEITMATRSVIQDTIPLEEQLPDDLPEEEKEMIMREYYEKKAEGLRRIKENLIAYNQTY